MVYMCSWDFLEKVMYMCYTTYGGMYSWDFLELEQFSRTAIVLHSNDATKKELSTERLASQLTVLYCCSPKIV